MNVHSTDLPEVLLIEPKVFRDARGFFLETWNCLRYHTHGLPEAMPQDNVSYSRHGVLRGLHYQLPHPQGKLVQVLEGAIFDVAVDIRRGSPNFGRWVGVELSSDNHRQLYIPEGFAHGFCVVSGRALVSYKCTEVYRPDCDASLAWNDPQIDIRWPIAVPVLSPKDAAAPLLRQVPIDRLPHYAPRVVREAA